MKRKVLISLITISMLLEGVFIYHLFNPLNIKELEKVQTQKVLKSNDKQLAIWVQETNGEWHEQEDRTKWPDSSTHGFVGAECTDSEGKDIEWEKVLTFSLTDKTATIKTKQTSYCTLYFATGETALEYLEKKGGSTFAGGKTGTEKVAVDGMYRFKGTNTQVLNNYICFGTTVESTCTANASGNYMYRIIGITSEADSDIGLYANQLKIIRAVPSKQNQQWHSSTSSNTRWGSSSAKNYLNGTFLNTIKNLPDGTYWDSMISQHGWYITDQTSIPGSTEPKDKTLAGDVNNRIGLMYGSDYINAYQNYSTDNWLLITNGWTNNPSMEEWTMTRYGSSNTKYFAWIVLKSGSLNRDYDMTFDRPVRPVFYLRPGVNLTGEGTKDHPYIITTMPNN